MDGSHVHRSFGGKPRKAWKHVRDRWETGLGERDRRLDGTQLWPSRAICWLLAKPDDLSIAAEEQALLSIALGAEIAHRRASFDLLEEGQDAIKRGGIVFSPLAQPARFAGCWVRVDGERWQYGGHSIDASSLEALRDLATALLVDSLS